MSDADERKWWLFMSPQGHVRAAQGAGQLPGGADRWLPAPDAMTESEARTLMDQLCVLSPQTAEWTFVGRGDRLPPLDSESITPEGRLKEQFGEEVGLNLRRLREEE